MKIIKRIGLIFLVYFFAFASFAKERIDPLPSWNKSPQKTRILNFVTDVTNKVSPHYISPENRIATFDNDGTLWVEHPLYTQMIFAIDRIKKLAKEHPELKKEVPYQTLLSGDQEVIAKLSLQDVIHILAVTHTGMTVSQFQKIVEEWLKSAKDPHFHRPYTELIYQPMLEVMNFLRQNNFKIYIVTGGGQEFVRAFANKVYKVEPEKVIGSSGKTKYEFQNNKPILIKEPEVFFVDDKTGKPVAINLFIGKKPVIAFGNSDGDREMLEWTQSNPSKTLMVLIHHDDAKREYAYGPQSKIGTFSDSLMKEAKDKDWQVISMKRDWKYIFPFERSIPHARKKTYSNNHSKSYFDNDYQFIRC